MRILSIACLLIVMVGVASAQTGSVCLYVQNTGTSDCNLESPENPGVVSLVHVGAVDATGARFRVYPSSCADWFFYSATTNFPVTGSWETGVTVDYLSCLSGDIHIADLYYIQLTNTGADCPVRVVPAVDAASGRIEVLDCNGIAAPAYGGTLWAKATINNDCACGVAPTTPILTLVPQRPSVGQADSGVIDIINVGTDGLTWSVSEASDWLDVTPSAGSGDQTLTLNINRDGLEHGFYTTEVTVNSNGGDESATIRMEVPGPEYTLSATNPWIPAYVDSMPIDIIASGVGELTWSFESSVPWLSVSPSSGTGSATVMIIVDRTTLINGTYHGGLLIRSNANSGPGFVFVTVLVSGTAEMMVSTDQIVFSPAVTQNTFDITNAAPATPLEWNLIPSDAWIDIQSPLSGTGEATVTVNVDPATVPGSGDQVGMIHLGSNGGVDSVRVIFDRPGIELGGELRMYSDSLLTDCGIPDAGGLQKVYVVHEKTPGSATVRFAAPLPDCWTGAVYLADISPFPIAFGDTQSGMTVSYQACLSGPILVTAILLQTTGNAQACCEYAIVPHPGATSGSIEAIACGGLGTVSVSGRTAYVNDDGSCPCSVPVKKHTWGSLRALFREKAEGSE